MVTDTYTAQLLERLMAAEHYRGDSGVAVLSQILADMLQHQDHMNQLVLHGIRKVADRLQAREGRR